MANRTSSASACPVQSARRQLNQAEGLPFAELLPAQRIRRALAEENVSFRERLFSPFVTLWVFLSQLLDADHSCRQAVARFLAVRTARGLAPCSADSGAYCKARSRLPEAVLRRLTRERGREILDQAELDWLWQGRRVKVVDGTTLSMPDTPENQEAFPQEPNQGLGVGFPLLRLVVVFSLAVGTVLEAALGRYQGKQTGEPALFRSLHDHLEEGDIVLADRYYCSFWEVALLQPRGIDVVFRMHQRRRVDFRRGCRLGANDHVAFWPKPQRPTWMSEEEYAALPSCLMVREVRVQVRVRGFRTQTYVVATTLRDAEAVSRQELADLYRARWQVELDLRSLKITMQMDILRGQTPAMVRKEVWGHLLAYNLIRGLLAEAARQAGVTPRALSFKGGLQTVNAFLPYVATARGARREALLKEMLRAMAQHRVGDRPNRVEPRARKRRRKNYPRLMEPRAAARARLQEAA